MCTIIPAIIADELAEVRETIKVVRENLDAVNFETVRAQDAYLLFKRLRKDGASEETASYAMYAFLRGNGNDSDDAVSAPDSIKKGEMRDER